MQKTARIGQVSIVQDKLPVPQMRILIEMVDAVRVEEGAAPLDSVNLIAFVEKKLRQIRPVLSGYARDQSNFSHVNS
jgi:hypothetical protein